MGLCAAIVEKKLSANMNLRITSKKYMDLQYTNVTIVTLK